MQKEPMFLEPPIKDFLAGAKIDPWIRNHCEYLAKSGTALLRAVAVGLLLDPRLPVEDVWQLKGIHDGIGHWLERVPKHHLFEIEDMVENELARQINNLRHAGVSTLDHVKLLEIRAQRNLLANVNRLLLRAKRPYVERRLIELDTLISSRL